MTDPRPQSPPASGPMPDVWQIDRLDLGRYLARLGVPTRSPSRAALAELHEAHVRTFTFDNIDVLLGQHPGVDLAAVQAKFVGRGRGGYCFEHATLVAAALERLGYDVRRHLGRVGDPVAGPLQGRTHMVVEVVLDGERLLCDPGFGMSLLHPIQLSDGAVTDHGGWRFRVTRSDDPTVWHLHRARESGWETMHNTDELPVLPDDIVIGHHYTSTFPGSHFTQRLALAKYIPGRHIALTGETVTIRRPGEPTEHRPLADGEFSEWLATLAVPLTAGEESRLRERLAQLRKVG